VRLDGECVAKTREVLIVKRIDDGHQFIGRSPESREEVAHEHIAVGFRRMQRSDHFLCRREQLSQEDLRINQLRDSVADGPKIRLQEIIELEVHQCAVEVK
jgi:hypothetical protein